MGGGNKCVYPNYNIDCASKGFMGKSWQWVKSTFWGGQKCGKLINNVGSSAGFPSAAYLLKQAKKGVDCSKKGWFSKMWTNFKGFFGGESCKDVKKTAKKDAPWWKKESKKSSRPWYAKSS